MGDEEKRLQILIQTSLDDKGAKAAQDALNKTKKANTDNSEASKKSANAMKSMVDASKQLGSIGVRMGVIGAAISGPILAATKNYVSTVGMAESTSRSWLGATYQIEQSYLRIGRVGAQQLLPFMQKAADLSDKAAGYIEKNPGVVKAGLSIGGTAAVIGGGFGALGILGSTISGISKLGGMLGLGGTAAQTGAGASGAVTAGATTAGATAAGTGIAMAPVVLATLGAVVMQGGFALAGSKMMNALGIKNQVGSTGWMFDKVGQAFTEGPDNALKSTGDDMSAFMSGKAMPDWLKIPLLGIGKGIDDNAPAGVKGVLDQLVQAIKSVVNPGAAAPSNSNFVKTEVLQQMRQFQIQSQYAEQDYNRSRFVANRNFGLQMSYSEADFYRGRQRSLRDFGINQVYSEQQFYRQRAIAYRDFSISVSRSEQDYNISRSRAAEDHSFSLKQIMLSGDALQYYYAQHQYNVDKKRAEQDYQLQKSRGQEDFNRQQADSNEQFGIQRAQTLKQFEISRADQQVDFDIQRKRQADQFAVQLSDMDYQYKLEAQRRWEGFKESVLPAIMTEENYRAKMIGDMNVTMVNNFDQLMTQFAGDWSGFMNSQGASAFTGAKAQAGYSSPATQVSQNNTGVIQTVQNTMVSNLAAWLKKNNWIVGISNALGMTSHAAGGYTKLGPAMLHANEFVLTANTTRYAEQVARGNLSQGKIASMLSGQGGFEYNDNRVFSRGLDSTEHQQLNRETRQMVMDAFR